MTYRGTVSKGVVMLPSEAELPDGAEVLVEPIEGAFEPVGKKLLALAGILKDLPEDFAQNHDHYVHGAPKRSIP
ncbi:MAG TPA: hypothetical protein VMT20_09325 [Terriglobia bacterium]|nr:hypothetical protein [Terriglobia bacterium]